jgi:Holliday junction resolvasome RuvABC endonuclease subunit
MVGSLLALPEPPASDHAADALALAICHAFRARAPGEGVRVAAQNPNR